MSDWTKCMVSKEELEKLYKRWASSEEAHKLELEAPNYGPSYMVLVTRWSNGPKGRFVKRSEYLFGTHDVARWCFDYWMARGGILTCALLEFQNEYGYTQDPADSEYYA
jgi:hypothetical protein